MFLFAGVAIALDILWSAWFSCIEDEPAADRFSRLRPDAGAAARGLFSSYPASAAGQAGYHMADTACSISADTWASACWSAWSAVEAADAVLAGELAAYALCRPPGHHAFVDVAGGFCFLNNSAIAAPRSACARRPRGWRSLHHGNGTQGIFYSRPDVLTVSLHADPGRFYPFFWGYANERGEGAGLGANLNLPLPRKSGDDRSSRLWMWVFAASAPLRRRRWSSRSASTPSKATRSAGFRSQRQALLALPRRSRHSACQRR